MKIANNVEAAAGPKEDTSDRNNRMFLVGLMAPMMMIVSNMSMFRLTLPTIRDTFQIQADVTAWLVTAYSLPFMLFMPLYGRLGDELGKGRLFFTGISIFLVGTAVNLVTPTLGLLFLGRAIQGIGAAGVTPLCIALITDYFPIDQRGKSLGIWNSMGPITGMAAPFLGGFLIEYVGWRTIFAFSLAAAVLSLFSVRRQVPHVYWRNSRSHVLRRFDWGGVVLLSLATMLLVFYTSSRPITGIAALQDWRLLTLALLAFAGFIIWQKRGSNPFVTLAIFANTNFTLASLSAAIRMFALNGITFLMPLYLTDVHALRATSIGFLTTLHAGALLATMMIGGHLADRWNGRWPVVIGLVGQAGMIAYLAWLPGTAVLGLVIAGLAGHGMGAGLSLAALHRASMSKILPEQTGIAAGLYSMIRFSGTVLGVALGGVILQQGFDQSLAVIAAYQRVFSYLATVALCGVVLAWRLEE
ncbi:MFS transporter [candidate division KSB3 bacterium]|uniref:MFS transporter n=1 Tax=candidate division KSB3 bacterium TaxID=2044937 RepID=A0A9D5JVD1_9BACT|nr:MFS transporter [candidate division KSB3 bacterium]MBD3324954.1 MFS transporter [candidate division KSB3 bacterium]